MPEGERATGAGALHPLLPAGGRAPVSTPRDRLDPRQLAALARLMLGQAVRRGVDPATGTRGYPLLQILLSMGFLGLLVATGVTQTASPDAFVTRVFLGAFVLVALAIVPDAAEVRDRHAEILGTRPVAMATHMAARGVLLFVLALLVGLPFALPGIAAAAWRFGLPAWRLPADVLALLAGTFALALAWVHVLLAAALRLGIDRVRRIVQSALMLLIVAISLLAALRLAAGVDAVPERLLAAAAAVAPSTWFALFWSSASLAQRAAALAFVAAALLLFTRRSLERYGEALLSQPAQAAQVRAPWAARAVLTLAATPLLGRVLPPPAVGVAVAALTLSRREEVARLKAGASGLLALGFFGWGLYDPAGLVPFWALQYFTLMSAFDGLDAVRQSAQPEAAWLFRQAPAGTEALVSGLQWAVTWRYTTLPLLLAAVLVARQKAWLAAALSVLLLGAAARLLAVAGLALRPFLPLAEPPRAGQSIAGQIAGWLLSSAALAGVAVLVLLAEQAGPPGALALLLGCASCLAATFAARALAAARLRGLLHEG